MKLKRLLTGVLSAVMALSVCAMPAMADEVKTSTSTINTETKGSITIYKYAQTDAEEKETAPDSTGEVTNGTIHGTALPNAVFTLYRVKNTEDLMKYYAGIQDGTITEAKVADYFTKGATSLTEANLLDAYKSEVDKNTATAVGKIESKTTGDNGGAYFGNLPVGLYLLIETKTPESVTVPAKPFLVSVPMTRVGTTGKDTQWLYDVTVYPKNSTVQGTVTLAKKGYDGKTTVDLAGVKFTLWKYDESSNVKAYKQIKTDIVTEANGTVKIENLVKGRYVLQETGYTDGNDKGYILNTTGIYAFSIDENGKVAENQIADDNFAGINNSEKVEVGNGFELDATNATITITNYKPDFKKNVTKRDAASPADNTTHDADYGIDEDVPYTLTINVPENVAKLQNFKVTDTALASQLKQNPDSIVVKGIAKGEGATENKLEPNVDYTASVTETGKNSVMLVDFKSNNNMTKIADYAGGTITITYTAKLQKDAVIANAGNVNTADLIYSRTTNTSSNESTPGNEPYQIEDMGVVYSFALNIKKTAQGGEKDKQALEKVTFDLYKKATKADLDTFGQDGKYTFKGDPCTSVSGEDAKKLGLPTEENAIWLKVGTLETDSKGEANASGLPAGEYKLVETKTVDGYNLLSEPVDAKLNLKYATEWNTTGSYENGKEIKRTYTTTTYNYKDEQDPVVPGTALNIVNRAGFTLPVTGGFGTLLFSGIGVLLVLAGVCVLFSMKKKNNRT